MRSHFSNLGVAALTALVAVVPTLMPAPARACSYLSPIIDAAFPIDGAADVPTNVVLFLHGSIGVEPGFVLIDEAGREVPIEVSPAEPRGVSLRPLTELAPDERYELRFGGEYGFSAAASGILDFTTGAGPAARREPPPAPRVRLREFAYPYFSCGDVHGLCLDGDAPEGYVLQLDVDGDVLLVHRGHEEPVHLQANRDFPDNGCIDVRLRGLLGDLSPTTRLCGAEVERVMVPFPGYNQVYSCDEVDAVLDATSSNDAGAAALPGDAGASVASGDLPASSDLARSAAPDAATAQGCSITSPTSATRHGWLGWSALALVLATRSRRRALAQR